MAAPQNLRSAFNGFNREDVVQYLEYINAKHLNQVNQLTTEVEELRFQLSQQSGGDDLQALVEQLTRQLEEVETEKIRLEERCAQLEATPPAEIKSEDSVSCVSQELEAYRRAERAEREARERAELIYHQANGVLAEATAKVDSIAVDITGLADRVMGELSQLQVAVSSSKRALQDAASIMNTIRPNK